MGLYWENELTVTPASSSVGTFRLASLSQSIDCCLYPTCNNVLGPWGRQQFAAAGQIAGAKSLPEYRQAQLDQRHHREGDTGTGPTQFSIAALSRTILGAELPVSSVMAIPDPTWD